MIVFNNLGKMGRLGNQMFQISSVLGIAKTTGQQCAFPEWEYQVFFEKPLPRIVDVQHFPVVTETGYHFNPYVGITHTDMDLNGYFQSPKYWIGHEDAIKSYFKLTQAAFHTVCENWLEIIKHMPPRLCKKLETVGMHVRRGDYTNISQHHTDLSATKYYGLALKRMQELLGHTEIDVVVFSDDIDFCKEYFKGKSRFYYAPVTDPVTDMFTLSLMDHHIIANSSFSFWAAYLSGNKQSYTVSPGDMIPWFGPAYSQSDYNTQDLIPKNWIQI